jgi:exopolyphosphatase/guanosine-5'-triphosphate,3'-diphosphate pyrophosphatase
LKNLEEYSKDLSRRDQLTVSRLCALLRLADAIEMSHTPRIRDVKMIEDKRCWHLQMNGEGNLLLEKWALAKRKSLFEEVFKTRLEVVE